MFVSVNTALTLWESDWEKHGKIGVWLFIPLKVTHSEGGGVCKLYSGLSLKQDYKTDIQRDNLWVTYRTGNHWRGWENGERSKESKIVKLTCLNIKI